MTNIEAINASINSVLFIFCFVCGYMFARYTKG
jgi:hypothetical protein